MNIMEIIASIAAIDGDRVAYDAVQEGLDPKIVIEYMEDEFEARGGAVDVEFIELVQKHFYDLVEALYEAAGMTHKPTYFDDRLRVHAPALAEAMTEKRREVLDWALMKMEYRVSEAAGDLARG